MGLDEQGRRFFHHDVHMIRPNRDEQFMALPIQGGNSFLIVRGACAIVTEEQARAINTKSEHGDRFIGVIDRIAKPAIF